MKSGMIRWVIKRLWILLMIVQCGCIQEIDLFEGGESPLIVSGLITDQQGPQTVRVFYLDGYNVPVDYNRVAKAEVKIVDDLGNEEILTHTGFGYFYSSADFKGAVGRTYQVKIRLENGREYESSPEQLPPVPEIDQVNYEMVGNTVLFNVDFDDPEGKNYYRWRFSGTFEVHAPHVFADQPIRNQCYDQSIYRNRAGVCWVSDLDAAFLKISNDELFDGRAVTNMPVYSVDVDRKFDFGYSGQIQLFSMTAGAYWFWSQIENQLGNKGTIFETSNYQVIGNMRSLDNPEEAVLGYFGASSVAGGRVFIDQFMGTFPPEDCDPNEAGCRPARCINCIAYGFSAQRVKPEYWPY